MLTPLPRNWGAKASLTLLRNWETKARLSLVLLLLLGACVRQPDPAVTLQNVQADIVFGVKPPEKGGAPVGISAPNQRIGDDDFGFEPPQTKRRPALGTPFVPCPPAELNEFPEQEASLNAVGMPAVGLYRWKRQGTQELTALPGFKIPVSGFEKRLIRRLKPAANGEFTFEMVQPDVANSQQTVVTTFKVRTMARSERVGAADLRAGEPDGGLSIVKIERFSTKTGDSISEFSPSPAVLLLPLPVVPGERFRGVGVDPRTLSALQIEGQVTKRQQVDACGEVIDGWAIEATRTFSAQSAPGTPQKFNYIVATQAGAGLIQETFSAQDATGKIDLTISIGQLKPDPLPQGSG